MWCKTRISWCLVAVALALTAFAVGCSRQTEVHWDLTNITGHLPDLAFSLRTKADHPLTAADLRGQVVLLYFGYMHCTDVCPMTMARLGGVVRQLGSQAAKVKGLFVSVDPQRDTPTATDTYAHAYSPDAIGATGSPSDIEELAKTYRVAYQADKRDASGAYEVMHSKAVYVFDGEGRARLLITDSDKPAAIVHDLRALLHS